MSKLNCKCPGCGRPMPYSTLRLTGGICNSCGYRLSSPLKLFLS